MRYLSIFIVEHSDGLHAYVWRQDGPKAKRRQVAVLWLPDASTDQPPAAVFEAFARQLRQSVSERPHP